MGKKNRQACLEIYCSARLLCQDDIDIMHIFLFFKKKKERIVFSHKGRLGSVSGHSSLSFIAFSSETKGMACFRCVGVNVGSGFYSFI